MRWIVIAKKAFGRTGHLSTRAIFGGASFSFVSQKDADRTLDLQEVCGHIDQFEFLT